MIKYKKIKRYWEHGMKPSPNKRSRKLPNQRGYLFLQVIINKVAMINMGADIFYYPFHPRRAAQLPHCDLCFFQATDMKSMV